MKGKRSCFIFCLIVLIVGMESSIQALSALKNATVIQKRFTEVWSERHHHVEEKEAVLLQRKTVLNLTEAFNDTEDRQDLLNLNYETLWQNGTVTSTKVQIRDRNDSYSTNGTNRYHVGQESVVLDESEPLTPANNTTNIRSSLSGKTPSYNSRLKRLIFGKDDRIKLNTSTTAQNFPFSTGVKISTGCSGSLISPYHVLTAAHCVHNGQQLLSDVARLRVGFLRRNGKLRWVRVEHVKLPEEWRRKTSSEYDYAVIKLVKAHKRQFFKIGVIASAQRQYKLHFVSFPGDKRANSMWYTHCFSRALATLLIARCDASTGSSGAGVYIRTAFRQSRKDRVIVGIVSGSGRVRLPDGRVKRFNFVTKLTPLMARQICQWTGAGAKCASWNSRNLSARGQLRKE